MDYNEHTRKVNGMELRIFLLSDFANVDAGHKLNIIGAFNTINAKEFPAVHPSMYLVAKVAAQLGEFGKQYGYQIVFFDEDAKELGKIEGKVTFPIPKGKQRFSEFNLVLALRDIPFPKAGRYEFRLLMNDQVLGEVPLDVMRLESPQE